MKYLILLLLLTSCAGTVGVGDSMMVGYGEVNDIKVYAKWGQSTCDMLDGVPLRQPSKDLIMWTGTAVSIIQYMDIDSEIECFENALQLFEYKSVTVILPIGIRLDDPARQQRFDHMRAEQSLIAKKYGAIIIDMLPYFKDGEIFKGRGLYIDLTHLNEAGYEMVKNKISDN